MHEVFRLRKWGLPTRSENINLRNPLACPLPSTMPRVQKLSKPRHDPLHAQLADDEVEARYGRISQPGKRKKSKRSADDEDGAEVRSILLLDARSS